MNGLNNFLKWLGMPQPSAVMRQLADWFEADCPHYRFATTRDIDWFIHLETVCYQNYLAWTRADFERDLLKNPYALYVIFPQKACIIGRITHKKAHISHLMVEPSQQRKGIGREMLTCWIRAARQMHSQSVTLEVRASNRAAIALYQQHGFVIVRTILRYYEDGEDALYMQLLLK
ncbi:MAG: ribosomal protein S18-alanine N-acetyltransferase [Aerococcaceae bacterium]|nr:ribosomal protein S18-alanine N-acetyltransferase [Aerococcaceae bacterium]